MALYKCIYSLTYLLTKVQSISAACDAARLPVPLLNSGNHGNRRRGAKTAKETQLNE